MLADAVPPDRKPLDLELVRRVTSDLEAGRPESLKLALDGKFIEERARFLQAVEDLNGIDVASHKRLECALAWIFPVRNGPATICRSIDTRLEA